MCYVSIIHFSVRWAPDDVGPFQKVFPQDIIGNCHSLLFKVDGLRPLYLIHLCKFGRNARGSKKPHKSIACSQVVPLAEMTVPTGKDNFFISVNNSTEMLSWFDDEGA